MRKWRQHDDLQETMAKIIREFGLNNAAVNADMRRSITDTRRIATGQQFTAVNQDNVLEMANMADQSVDLIVSSWPFSNHYEYTETFNDFGHNEDDARFFEQMDFLTPETLRVLKPGRMYCVHCKDRLLYGSVTGLGMYSVNPFSDKCVAHLRQHGFIYCGRITIVTDVVRENNQTYRLGWTEKCKDGTKMGVGSPEYILLFRKLPTDTSRAYADTPVVKSKQQYTRSRWQFDASPFWRSNGDRFLTPEEIRKLPQEVLRQAWHAYNRANVYDFSQHVKVAEALESEGLLPASFMLLDPTSHSPWVWEDITRMRTLNSEQSRRKLEMHICPLQLDVVERLIETYSAPGELVFDPFAGIMTVPYVAVKSGRKGYGIELSPEYWTDGVAYCRAAEAKYTMPSLFDVIEAEDPKPEPSLPLD
jgi:DNA modification methylase